MQRFNEWLAQRLGNTLSSMAFFYICVVLDLVELPPVIAAGSVIVWCTYLSQTVIQLIALPILGSQQKKTHQHHAELMENHGRIEGKLNKILGLPADHRKHL